MGWNGSDIRSVSKHNDTEQQIDAKKFVLSRFCLLAIGFICFAIGIFCLFLSPDENENNVVVESKSIVCAINPIVNTNINGSTVVRDDNLVRCWDGSVAVFPPKNAYKDEEGIWRHPGGQMCFDPRPKPRKNKHQPRQIFDTNAESQIAELLTIKPGTMVFGTMHYDRPLFKKEFAQALITPTKINKDDSEADAQLKSDVREVMQDLAMRMKNGEDIAIILSETREELQRSGRFKHELMKNLRNMATTRELSEQDVRDSVLAANQMLESEGIAPIKITDLLIRNLQRTANGFHGKQEE